MSVVIWSLIAAKAKTGLDASQNGQTTTVASALKKAGSLIVLIVAASAFNVYAQMDQVSSLDTVAPTRTSLRATKSNDEELSDDIYSSHYNGGVANAAYEQFKKMNYSLSKLKEKKTSAKKSASIDLIFDSFEQKITSAKTSVMSANDQDSFNSVGAFLLCIFTCGISLSYYVSFKTYHASLKKMDALKELLTNPNARVAAGETGKSILARLHESNQAKEAPNKIVQSTKADETVELLKKLIEAKQVANSYKEPLIQIAPAPVKKADETIETIKKLLAQR